MPSNRSVRSPDRNGAGTAALVAGIVAAGCAFLPFLGDLVTIPAGVAAVVCGWVGLGRVDKGSATNHGEALAGAVLGIAALFVVFVVFAATHTASG
ncbi:hypothetical protein [Rhodococcus rhodochrous]|uniref:DUF4190 domain-containing protein n=1 Tax=Rhodococcus rhodochrous KG-21 TaxID=1441923 RepID=A0A0N0S0T6_RHORH|nr:hypothetical protein [Rhodococcus rhodochrous]KOS56027.1 hypothetical protein Z051_12015 [Rhodococcus rhodochrous KG-21]